MNLATRVGLADASASAVLLHLALWADESGGCRATNAAIARATGLSPRGVRYVLARLFGTGMVRAFHLPGGRRLVLVADALVHNFRPAAVSSARTTPPVAGGWQSLPGGRQLLPPMNKTRFSESYCRAVYCGDNVHNATRSTRRGRR